MPATARLLCMGLFSIFWVREPRISLAAGRPRRSSPPPSPKSAPGQPRRGQPSLVSAGHSSVGERGGARTHDPVIKSHVLYRLSYALTEGSRWFPSAFDPLGYDLRADATGVCRAGKPAASLTMPQPRCVGGGPPPVNSPARPASATEGPRKPVGQCLARFNQPARRSSPVRDGLHWSPAAPGRQRSAGSPGAVRSIRPSAPRCCARIRRN